MIAFILSHLLLLSAAEKLDWEMAHGYRSAALRVSSSGEAGFTLLPPQQTGILFTNLISEQRHLTNQILLNGSGVAAGDVDGDGWSDLYFCRLEGANVLYRNLGNWKFEEIGESAGVQCRNLISTGCAFADVDGDGDLDLIVNTLGNGTHLFFNDGKGHFKEAPFVLNENHGGMSMALGDLDGDGFLDLYIANYRTSGLMDMPNARATFKRENGKLVVATVDGRPVTEPDLKNRFVIGPRGNVEEQGEPDRIYHNIGGTNFVPVSFTDGTFLDEEGRPLTEPPYDWGLSVMIRDANQDGLPDIYVCNDLQTEDRFWINQGHGKFRALPKLAQRKSSFFSMSVDFADIDRDGFDDFLVVDMMSRHHAQRVMDLKYGMPLPQLASQIEARPQYEMNTLFLNRGDDTYAEIAQLSGLAASEWSWSCIFLDVDLDGWEDVLVCNGMERAARDLDVLDQLKAMRARKKMSDTEIFQARRMFPRLATANAAFRNRGDLTFEEKGHDWRFDLPGVSNGMALADLDNDGDADVIINNLNGPATIYRNEANRSRVAVRLKGLPPNTHGIGARIRIRDGAVPVQSQEMLGAGRYLSSDDTIRTFAGGAGTNKMTIEVAWRSGRRSAIDSAVPNRVYEIDESAATDTPEAGPQTRSQTQPVFEDRSAVLHHTHVDEAFDDFARQPLLARKLSQSGPGVAWIDLNNDGYDDLLVGTGKKGELGVFLNEKNGQFKSIEGSEWIRTVTRDQTGFAAWHADTNNLVFLAGFSNYEDGLALGAAVRQYDWRTKTVKDLFAAWDSSVGPLAAADIDGDGDLDVFTGGTVMPGKYPGPATSRLFRNSGGAFTPDSANNPLLDKIGLVNGAIFTDIDLDGDPDLILACDWSAIRILINDHGKFSDQTARWKMDSYIGWWNGIAVGDFDEDGRIDLVASNWGKNSQYESDRSRPLETYYGDFDESGVFQLIETHFDSELNKIVPYRQLAALAGPLSFIRAKFATQRSFSAAGIDEILGDKRATTGVVRANTLESMIFMNRGDHFEGIPLPIEAQFAPGFGVCVGDFNGDGHDDLFLAQNFFAVSGDTARYDAGRGLLLFGDGKGRFRAASGMESGLKIYGEQRGCAAADYDGDGRLDLVVGQNSAETKLFHNVSAPPGLRIKLEGKLGNSDAIGAKIQLLFNGGQGPVHELHAGSGYLSQDSPVQIMSGPVPRRIRVQWPDGTRTESQIPSAAKNVRITVDGKVHAN